MPAAVLTADLLVNGVAFAALAAALVELHRRAAPSAVEKRLRALFASLALLLLLRGLYWWQPRPLLGVVVTVAAAWLPLLAVRLVEHLLRRHAPAQLKYLVLGGAFFFTAVAVIVGPFWMLGPLVGLAAFQFLVLLWLVGLVVRTGADDLAPAERRVAVTFAIALLLALPLMVTDFRGLFPDLPVRLGSFGVLIPLVATSRFPAGLGSPMLLLADLATLVVGSAIVTGGVALLLPAIDIAAAVQMFALTLAAAALMLVVLRQRERALVDRVGVTLVSALAGLPDEVDETRLLAAHPLLASGRPVEDEALSLYDRDSVGALAGHRVVTAATPLDPPARDAARDLLDRYAASHLVRLARDPPRFMALATGGLDAEGPLAAELDLVARLLEGRPR